MGDERGQSIGGIPRAQLASRHGRAEFGTGMKDFPLRSKKRQWDSLKNITITISYEQESF